MSSIIHCPLSGYSYTGLCAARQQRALPGAIDGTYMYPRGSLLVMYRPLVTWWCGLAYGRKRWPAFDDGSPSADAFIMGSCSGGGERSVSAGARRAGRLTSSRPDDMLAAWPDTKVIAGEVCWAGCAGGGQCACGGQRAARTGGGLT